MASESDKFWHDVSKGLRRFMGLDLPTDNQVQAEFESLGDLHLPEEEVDTIVHSVMCNRPESREQQPNFDWLSGIDMIGVQDEAMALARDEGEKDEEIDRRLDQLRKAALEEESPDDGKNGEGEPNGLENSQDTGEESR